MTFYNIAKEGETENWTREDRFTDWERFKMDITFVEKFTLEPSTK